MRYQADPHSEGATLNLRDFTRLLRTYRLTILLAVVSAVAFAAAVTLLTTPQYQAATRLFVSTTSSSSISEQYQGNRLSQDRVLSYVELLKGRTLAQRTVDKLDLKMTADQLRAKIDATSKVDTVLIRVTVLDESPVRARDIANALSDEFVSMVRELETPGPGARPDARVVVEQRAAVPAAPMIPNRTRNIALGVVLGLLLGIGLAVLRDLLDNTVKDRATLEQITSVGLVGVVPLDKDRRDKPAISFDQEHSGIAEAFRKLRTNLQFLSVDNPPRVIVITSAVPSEGKSTTAINLALALTEADYNVVLVDGDMRRPSLGKYLDLIGAVGFSSVLSGGASLSEVLQTTRFPRLTVLAAGPTPPNPSELLGSMAAKKTLNELRESFDYVIVDSAPLLAVTDGSILASNADGALVIVQAGQTKREQVIHAMAALDAVGAHVLGSVLSMTPTGGPGYYGYEYGYYGGYYGEDLPRDHHEAELAEAAIERVEAEVDVDVAGKADRPEAMAESSRTDSDWKEESEAQP